ncbi:hypothetical protein XFF6990_130193 [Xanthomonas citri pv. fuscans]|uniref:Uncharacterized protein n=1 Tax=Xanthomonas campestris pv. phaseoli TaxID=317013 RepID=A0A7Z7IZN2_XANCH|nr:hypothetical protein XFF6990_130193 [Xanthomonas citri pv. fuscans]SOO24578.1 hypothetical protein XFF6991_390026 [Xanthomonas phaseoli pv. phaseoli]
MRCKPDQYATEPGYLGLAKAPAASAGVGLARQRQQLAEQAAFDPAQLPRELADFMHPRR